MLLAAALGLQDFCYFVGGGVLFEVAENGEDGIAHMYFGHAVWTACGVSVCLLGYWS